MISETQHVLSEREAESYLEEARLHDALSEYSQISVRAEAYVPELKEEGRVRRKTTANKAAARSDIAPGRFKRGKKIGKIQISRWIGPLDPWNHYVYRDYPGTYTPVFLNAWELRAREPDHITVSVEKDVSSDIPDIDMTKYNVHCDMPLKEFVDFIRLRIQHDFPWKKSMFVYFKNTEPPIGTTLMSEVDEKNRDKDGWVRITYSGKEKGSWTR
ncbi:hypothetical protein ACFX13_005299 [Malus domestica]